MNNPETRCHYTIGGHTFAVEGEDLCAILADKHRFERFLADNMGKGEAEFHFMETSEIPPASGRLIYQLKDEDTLFLFTRTSAGYRLHLRQDCGKALDLWLDEGSREMRLAGDMDKRMLYYALWFGYGLQTLSKQTVMVHSSCIVCHEGAILFLGESGTGKSTHTRLWREHIAGAHLLNDDSPVLRIEEGEVWVYGSPWSGKTPCYRTERYRLKACVRLSQAPRNEIKRLSVLQGYAALHPSFPPPFAYERSLYNPLSRMLGDILSQVPCYHLACLPDEEAARLSHDTLFNL